MRSRGYQSTAFSVAIFLIVFATLSGCFNIPPPSIVVSGVPLSSDGVKELCIRINQRAGEIENLRALYNVNLVHALGKDYFRYAVVAKAPDALRVDLLPTQGAFSLGIFSANASGAQMIDIPNKQVVISTNPDQMIQKLFGDLSVGKDDVMALLTGRVPSSTCSLESPPVVNFDPTLGRYFLESYRGIGKIKEIWEINSQSALLEGLLVYDRSGDNAGVEGRVDNLGEMDLPQHIGVVEFGTGAKADLDRKQAKVNTELKEALFDIQIPEGFEVVQADKE